MLPKTLTGWAILIIVIAILIWGPGGAGSHLGSAAHEVLAGTRHFFAGLRG
jgi:hypothetical protein